jgi:hypothetical protein|nr:MAG TPA: Glycophorin A [Caudoviricetes sp.]
MSELNIDFFIAGIIVGALFMFCFIAILASWDNDEDRYEEYEDESPIIRPAIEPVVEPVISGIYKAPRAYDQEKDLSFGGYCFNRKK